MDQEQQNQIIERATVSEETDSNSGPRCEVCGDVLVRGDTYFACMNGCVRLVPRNRYPEAPPPEDLPEAELCYLVDGIPHRRATPGTVTAIRWRGKKWSVWSLEPIDIDDGPTDSKNTTPSTEPEKDRKPC